jgi:hypothetical protein
MMARLSELASKHILKMEDAEFKFERAENVEKFKKSDKTYLEMKNLISKAFAHSWDKINGLREKIAQHDSKEFLKSCRKKHPQLYIGIFEYSDNDGSHWALMEHGQVFRNLPHAQISHH